MEMKSPPTCPHTVTIRRNPHRKARATPSSAVPLRKPLSSPSLSRDIFSTEVCQNPSNTIINTEPSTRTLSENLKVYLRIRPLTVQRNSKNVAESKNAWPKNPKIKSNARLKSKKSSEICVQVNEDLHSVTVSTPQSLQETKRIKSEVYGGFSHVFASEASQSDVYEEMVKPVIEDFLKGKSGMLAAMGPSGSGKTHTVFGSAREPGMVPLALRRIFSENESSATKLSRVFYLSMFEISSEKGKTERMIDLLHDGGDIGMQNSVVKGLQEAVVCDAQQAESLIARGMLKRATAMTNSNSQSSRSQCIINIRCDSERGYKEVDGKTSSSILTIVDLAGAEREKKTGNQGARLLESSFINNTSMVFGLCLRSLLEHQKSRNKPLQKHYQNSLLTRYMRDYLEGKKRMMLVLTVRPGVEDYLDTSFLLRQASPFTKIKFKPMEEPVHLTCNKRPNQALPRAEQLKKMKFNTSESSLIDEEDDRGFHPTASKEIARKLVKDCLSENIQAITDEDLNEIPNLSAKFLGLGIQEKSSTKSEYSKEDGKKDRRHQIMQGLAKAMWTVLKQYKEKLEVVEIENCHLKDSLTNEKSRRLDLENECTSQNMRLIDLENELIEFKSLCTCLRSTSSDALPVSSDNASYSLLQHQVTELQEVNSDVSSYSLNKLEQTEKETKTDPSQLDDILQISDDAEDAMGFQDKGAQNVCSISEELWTNINNAQELVCYEDLDTVAMSCRSESTTHLMNSEKGDVTIVGNVKNLETNGECVSNGSCPATSLECETAKSLQDYEDLTYAKEEPTQLENGATDGTSSLVVDQIVSVAANLQIVLNSSESPLEDDISLKDEQLINVEGKKLEDLLQSSDDAEDAMGFNDSGEVDVCIISEELSTNTNNAQDLIWYEDNGRVVMSCRSGATAQFMNSEKDDVNTEGNVTNLETDRECVSNGSCPATSLECESAKCLQDSEDLKDAKREPTQLENDTTDSSLSLVEDRIVSVAANLQTVLNSSESPLKEDISFPGDDEQLNNGEGKEPLNEVVAILPKEGLDAENMSKFVPKLAACNNFQHREKPRRRLLPASSVLVKDISLLDSMDENDNVKGGRGVKRVTMDDKKRTQGSLSLLNLLTSSKLNR